MVTAAEAQANAIRCMDRGNDAENEDAARYWLGEAQVWATLAVAQAIAEDSDRRSEARK